MVQVRKILVSFSWSRKWIRPKTILTSSSTRTFLKAKFLAVCEERGEITKMLKTRSSVEGDFGAKVGKSNHELSSKRCLSFKHSSLAKLVLGFEPTSSISTYSWLRVHPCLTTGFIAIIILSKFAAGNLNGGNRHWTHNPRSWSCREYHLPPLPPSQKVKLFRVL